jgi:hypothetical protein
MVFQSSIMLHFCNILLSNWRALLLRSCHDGLKCWKMNVDEEIACVECCKWNITLRM